MRKDEYLSILSERLKVLPADEYNDIMEYYKEYFEDAGIENEEKVISELGDVEVLAKKIINENIPSYTSTSIDGKGFISILTVILWVVVAITLFAVVLALGVANVVCFVVGVACIIVGCMTLGASVATGLLFAGAGFVVIAVALGLSMATLSLSKLMTRLYRKFFGNKKNVELEKKHI